jgi:hypothetical protein
MMQQLDIFADSRDVAMRNDVVEQLQLRDAAAAGAALTVLAAEYARDNALPAMTVLVHELENASTLAVTDHTELAVICRHLEHEVSHAAQHVLPEQYALTCGWQHAGVNLRSVPRRCGTVAQTLTVTRHRCGFEQATGPRLAKRSKRLHPGGAFRRRLPG